MKRCYIAARGCLGTFLFRFFNNFGQKVDKEEEKGEYGLTLAAWTDAS
jgi:hypothetical protein